MNKKFILFALIVLAVAGIAYFLLKKKTVAISASDQPLEPETAGLAFARAGRAPLSLQRAAFYR